MGTTQNFIDGVKAIASCGQSVEEVSKAFSDLSNQIGEKLLPSVNDIGMEYYDGVEWRALNHDYIVGEEGQEIIHTLQDTEYHREESEYLCGFCHNGWIDSGKGTCISCGGSKYKRIKIND